MDNIANQDNPDHRAGTFSPTIGLWGIGGVYNYGCEAIVRGTEIILREIWPEVRIIYASPRSEDDRKRLAGSRVEIISNGAKTLGSLKRLYNWAAGKFGVPWRFLAENMDWVDRCDIIFSIGGDIHTIDLYHNYCRFKPYYHKAADYGKRVMKRGKPVVIWGATIGPFQCYPKAERYFADYLSKVLLISCREPDSIKYLEDLGITENVTRCADPAFAVPFDGRARRGRSDSPRIAVNLSPLSAKYLYGLTQLSKACSEQAELVVALVRNLEAEVVLVPHVVADFKYRDDDYSYLRSVQAALPRSISSKVQLLDKDIGFVATKKRLMQCDMLIAARMHCAINAIAAGVPTILLAYSQKARGMVKYVYGNEKWLLSIIETTPDKLTQLARQMLEEHDKVQAHLVASSTKFQQDARLACDRLVNYFQDNDLPDFER